MEIGSKYVVFYSDDSVWHERFLLLPGHEDVCEEDMRRRAEDGPQKVRFVPVGVKTLPNLRAAVYRFRSEVTDQILLSKVRAAFQEHKAAYGEDAVDFNQNVRLPSGASMLLSAALPRRRLSGKGPVGRTPGIVFRGEPDRCNLGGAQRQGVRSG